MRIDALSCPLTACTSQPRLSRGLRASQEPIKLPLSTKQLRSALDEQVSGQALRTNPFLETSSFLETPLKQLRAEAVRPRETSTAEGTAVAVTEPVITTHLISRSQTCPRLLRWFAYCSASALVLHQV